MFISHGVTLLRRALTQTCAHRSEVISLSACIFTGSHYLQIRILYMLMFNFWVVHWSHHQSRTIYLVWKCCIFFMVCLTIFQRITCCNWKSKAFSGCIHMFRFELNPSLLIFSYFFIGSWIPGVLFTQMCGLAVCFYSTLCLVWAQCCPVPSPHPGTSFFQGIV